MEEAESENMSKKQILKTLSDDSESDSSSEDESKDEELAINIATYKKQIKENDLNYDAHLGLIQTLRKCGELEELRSARQAMNKIFPLTPELWMDWVSDEQKICSSEQERSFIITLFKQAVQEYISVQLWVEYIMFMLGGGKMEDTRKVCDEALMAVGIHLAEGILVWQAVILVEQQHFLSLSQENKKEIEEQRKKIQNIYKRQARVPLMNLNKSEFIAEASKWFDKQIDPQIKRDLDTSFKKVAEKLPFEEALLRANDETEKLEAYRKYIDFVRRVDHPAAIQNLYERTVRDLCLNAGIWEEYVRFTMEQFSSAHYVILPVCKRSLLNCPWSSSLFELHLTALQMFQDVLGEEEVQKAVKESLAKTLRSGVSNEVEIIKIWMAYLVYLRRKIDWSSQEASNVPMDTLREGCDQAINFIQESLGIEGDKECSVARFRARIEAQSGKNMEGARAIWNDHIMKRNNNFKVAALWLEFINLERSYGDEKHCRKLYRRAIERVWDQVEMIGNSFLQFEQELGSLETMMDFERRYKDRLLIVQKRRMEDLMKEESKKQKVECDARGKGKKREETQTPQTTVAPQTPPQSKSTKMSPTKGKKMTEAKMDIDESPSISKGQKRNISDVDVSPPPGYKPKDSSPDGAKKQKVSDQHGEQVEHDPSLDFRTVFLSNMDYNAKEDEILAVFADCGPVETFRAAKDFKGRSKGFGYLVFKSPTSVPAALKKDRTPVGTRPLFVSECNPKSREKAFKFSTGLEKEKLFVKGLPFSMNEDDVRTVFRPHGDIKSLRLVTHRNGFSKGTCYIEYHDAATAERVLRQMDGAVLKDHKITVLISNPSNPSGPSNPKPEGGSTTRQRTVVPSTSGTRPRDKLSLLPRSLMRKPVAGRGEGNGLSERHNGPSTSQNGNGPSTSQTGNGVANGAPTEITPKSNNDFRNLFLK